MKRPHHALRVAINEPCETLSIFVIRSFVVFFSCLVRRDREGWRSDRYATRDTTTRRSLEMAESDDSVVPFLSSYVRRWQLSVRRTDCTECIRTSNAVLLLEEKQMSAAVTGPSIHICNAKAVHSIRLMISHRFHILKLFITGGASQWFSDGGGYAMSSGVLVNADGANKPLKLAE